MHRVIFRGKPCSVSMGEMGEIVCVKTVSIIVIYTELNYG